MGRRRRKNNPRRRSLVFEESPVEGGPLALSPVLCAENPVTAASVPIHGHCSSQWVSPQFNGITVSSRRRRQTRQRQNTNGSHRDGSIRGKCSRKYPALQFLGEPATSPTPSAVKAARSGKSSRGGCVPHKNVQNGNASCDNCEDEDVCAEVVRRVSLRRSGDRDCRPSLGCCSEFRGRSSTTPADSSFNQPVPSAQRRTPAESTHVCSVLRSQTKNSRSQNGSVTSVEKGHLDKRKGYDSDILLSPLETSASSPSERLTPVTAGVIPIPLRVALFALSPSDDAFNTSVNGCSPHRDSPSLPDIVSHGKRSSRIGSAGEEGPQSRRKTTLPAEKPRRSKRLQDKVKEAMRYLQPGTPQEKGAANVLVSDTPETEYSLSYRQRQRLKRKGCT